MVKGKANASQEQADTSETHHRIVSVEQKHRTTLMHRCQWKHLRVPILNSFLEEVTNRAAVRLRSRIMIR